MGGENVNEFLEQGSGVIRSCGCNEAGPAAFPGITVQGELGNNQSFPSDIEHRPVHLPLLVFEDPQVDHLVRQPARILLAIAYVRDKNHAQARETLLGLQQEFPENRLFAKELARLDKIASR